MSGTADPRRSVTSAALSAGLQQLARGQNPSRSSLPAPLQGSADYSQASDADLAAIADHAVNGLRQTDHWQKSDAELQAEADAIVRHASHQHPNAGAGEDMARGGLGGLMRGLAAEVAAPTGFDLPALVGAGLRAGAHAGQSIIGRKDDGTADRWAKRAEDMAATAVNMSPAAQPIRLAASLRGQPMAPNAHLPTSAQMVSGVPGADYEAHSSAGRIAQAGGYGLAAGPRGVLPAAAGAAASEVAPKNLKLPAQVLGTLLAGGAQSGVEAAFRSPQRALAEALDGMTEAQSQQVEALRADAAARGINLSVPEAVAQVTKGATSLPRLQRLLENNRQTQRRWAEYYADRPEQIGAAVGDFAQGVAPDMNPRPGMIALDAQRAGQGAIDTARRGINDAAKSSYDALPGQSLSAEEYATLHGDPAYAAALADVRGNDILNGPIAHLPDNDLSVINEVVKRLDRNANAARVTQLNPNGDNQIAAANTSVRTRADLLADAVSKDWSNARGIVAAGHRAVLDPMQAGPVGKIAATEDLPTQTAALYPQNPPVGARLETAEAVGALNRQDPQIAAALTRQHLQNTLNQSTRELVGGQNQYGGALFVKNLRGNPEQAATLDAGLSAIDPTGRLSQDMNSIAEILQATGRRERPGSMTAFNIADTNALNLAPKAVRFLGSAADPLEWGKHLSEWAGVQMGKRRNEILSQLLTDPDTAAVLARARAASQPQPVQMLPAYTAATYGNAQ